MVDFKELLGEAYREDMTVAEFVKAMEESKKDLVEWNDDKYTTKAKYIALEKQMLDEKSKKKSIAEELEALKNANLSAEDKAELEKKELLKEIASLKLNSAKAQVKSMYAKQGYSNELCEELMELEFYEGEDKYDKKATLLEKANNEVIAKYKNSILDSTTIPTTSTGATMESKKAYYKTEYTNALNSGRSDMAAAVLTRAMNEGIDIHN